MNFGISEKGFKTMRLPDLLDEFNERAKELLGQNIDTDPASEMGQLMGVLVYPLSILWEQLSILWYAITPKTANGVQLDNCVNFSNTRRIKAYPTKVKVALFGDSDTILSKGFVVSSDKYFFDLIESTILSGNFQKQIYVLIKDYEDVREKEFTFSVSKNSDPSFGVYVIAAIDETMETLFVKIKEIVEVDQDFVATYLGNGMVSITPTIPNVISVTIQSEDTLQIAYVGVFNCEETGPISVISGDITNVPSLPSGLTSVYNYEDGTKGSLVENDVDLYSRFLFNIRTLSSGNIDSIVSKIKNTVVGVVVCKGKENARDVEYDGLPPHSILLIISGGDPVEIAKVIWASKSGGIFTAGNILTYVEDSNGTLQEVRFSRPTEKFAWIKVVIGVYSEEIFPPDGSDKITQSLLSYCANVYTLDLDLIPIRFVPPILSAVNGILTIEIWVALMDSIEESPIYTKEAIPIDGETFASFNENRIEISYT